MAALATALVLALVAVAVLAVRQRRTRIVLDEVLDHAERPEAESRPGETTTSRLRRVTGHLARAATDAEHDVERLEQALDRLRDGVVISDGQGRVVFTNRAGAALAAARHGDALVAEAVDECLAAAAGGDAVGRSVELFGPPARVISVQAEPLVAADGADGAVAVVADTSRVQRLESVRSDFVANVSHELKTPIGGLALLAEALAATVDPGEQERLSGRLLHEAHRLGRVVDDLLALNAVESDRADRRQRLAAQDLVARAAGEVAVLAEASGVEVATEVADDLWLEGDPVQLTSALGNLVENAVKYSGGASPVVVTAAPEAGCARFTVTDRGIGIPRRDLDRVFERFYRVDPARSQATGGTGLGLALVRNIVRSHGGEVELSSREGEGTIAVVRLPAADGGAMDGGSTTVGPEGRAPGGHG